MSSEFTGEREPRVDLDLLELEKYIHDIWEFLPVPICQISPRGIILDSDKAFEELLGYPKDELVGTLLSHYFCKQDEFSQMQGATLSQGSVSDCRVTMKGRDDDFILVSMSTLLRRDEQGEHLGYFASFIDITKRERSDEALRESEEKYSMLFHNSNDAIFIHDFEGRILDVNKKVLEEFGYSRDEFLTLNISDIHPGNAQADSRNAFAEVEESGAAHFEIDFLRKDGSTFPAEVSSSTFVLKGRVIVQGIVRNATERKLAIEALRESEEKYRSVVEHSLQGIIVFRVDPLRMLFANSAITRIFGYPAEMMIGFTPDRVTSLIHEEDRTRVLERLLKIAGGASPSPLNQLRIVRKDGTFAWIEVYGTRIRYEGQQALQVSVIDITDRKRMEADLRESEEKYRNLVERSLLGIIIGQMEPFSIFFANGAAARIFGYVLEEFVELPPEQIRKLIHPEDMPAVVDQYTTVLGGGAPKRQEIRIRTKEGAERWIELFGHRIERQGRSVLQVTILDITEKREAERARIESELRYRILFEKAPLSITIVDTAGRVTNCNRRTEEITGFSRAEIVGKRFDELLTLKPETLPTLKEKFEHLMMGEEAGPYELEIVNKDGKRRMLQITNSTVTEKGRITGFQIITIDISERTKMEEALRESEEKYRLLLEQSGDIISYFNAEGRCLAMNRNAAAGFQSSPEGLVGKHLSDLFREEIAVSALERIRRVAESGKSEEHEDYVQFPVGKGWFRSSYHPVEGAKGNVIGVQIISRDITERRRMEEELQRSERMKLLAQLAIGVSHEVRNPLGAILASTEALCHDLEGNSEYSEYLSHIRSQVNRLSNLMKDLLELGKPIAEGTFEDESLQMVCSSGVELWKQSTSYREHVLRFAKPEGLENIIVRGDNSRLQQVCINLLENAAQNSPAGSTITLRILDPENGTVRIQVIDEGSGITEEDLERVFEPFFSTRKQGSGLGLSIVKQIIDTHGGKVDIRNNEGKPGCTAEVVLPLAS